MGGHCVLLPRPACACAWQANLTGALVNFICSIEAVTQSRPTSHGPAPQLMQFVSSQGDNMSYRVAASER